MDAAALAAAIAALPAAEKETLLLQMKNEKPEAKPDDGSKSPADPADRCDSTGPAEGRSCLGRDEPQSPELPARSISPSVSPSVSHGGSPILSSSRSPSPVRPSRTADRKVGRYSTEPMSPRSPKRARDYGGGGYEHTTHNKWCNYGGYRGKGKGGKGGKGKGHKGGKGSKGKYRSQSRSSHSMSREAEDGLDTILKVLSLTNLQPQLFPLHAIPPMECIKAYKRGKDYFEGWWVDQASQGLVDGPVPTADVLLADHTHDDATRLCYYIAYTYYLEVNTNTAGIAISLDKRARQNLLFTTFYHEAQRWRSQEKPWEALTLLLQQKMMTAQAPHGHTHTYAQQYNAQQQQYAASKYYP